MNTNYQSTLDDAIKRPGRFDLLLFVGPPPWDAKVVNLQVWWNELPEADRGPVKALLDTYAPAGSPVRKTLDMFTIDETSSFLRALVGQTNQKANLEALGKRAFDDRVKEWGETYITLRKGGSWYKALEDDTQASRRQYTP